MMRLSRRTISAFVAAAFAMACGGCTTAPPAPQAGATPSPSAAAAVTDAAAAPAPPPGALSPSIPHDANFDDNPQTLAAVQKDFDVFSWRSFVALNWPT